MMKNLPTFTGLSFIMWLVNTMMSPESEIWAALGATLGSIPVWASLGAVFSTVGLFAFHLAKVDVTMSLWQKANLGLVLGVVLKPLLGIPV